TVARSAGEWQVKLNVTHDAARAAQVVVGQCIARTQRRTFVAAHRTYAAAVYVLDDRVGLAAVGLAPVGQAIECQRVGPAQGQVVLLLGAKHVVAQVHGGQVARQAGVAALGRRDGAVARVLGPAHVEDDRIGGFAIFRDEVLIGPGCVLFAEFTELVVLEADACEDAVELGDGHAEIQAAAKRRDAVAAEGVPAVVRGGAAIVNGRGLADAVLGPVRIGVRNNGTAIGLAGIDLQGQGVAAAKYVV